MLIMPAQRNNKRSADHFAEAARSDEMQELLEAAARPEVRRALSDCSSGEVQ